MATKLTDNLNKCYNIKYTNNNRPTGSKDFLMHLFSALLLSLLFTGQIHASHQTSHTEKINTNLNLEGHSETTPLEYAATHNQPDAVLQLLLAGASTNTNCQGKSFYKIAEDKPKIQEAIREYVARLVSEHLPEDVDLLVADFAFSNVSENTRLLEKLKIALENGADVNGETIRNLLLHNLPRTTKPTEIVVWRNEEESRVERNPTPTARIAKFWYSLKTKLSNSLKNVISAYLLWAISLPR